MESLGTEARMEPRNPRQALFTFLPFYPFLDHSSQKVQKRFKKSKN
nr:MAG TPA: hypothetical protein [Caudoviricetes sp.]